MKKYFASAVVEIVTFVLLMFILWNITKMDAVEIIAIDLFIAYCSGILTFMGIEEREKKKCRIRKHILLEYLKTNLHSAMKFAKKNFTKEG